MCTGQRMGNSKERLWLYVVAKKVGLGTGHKEKERNPLFSRLLPFS